MQQPSAQGIASLFMGNPGALQQKVKDSQQKAQKGELTPDLQQLMEAQGIVQGTIQAGQRQNAMNQMQQMAPGGQMPTVAQSIYAQAKQKIQAQMVQQQRQQQAMQELAKQRGQGEVPENPPQPEHQPQVQGLDQLPVEFGFKGGGIVAFAEGDSVMDLTRKLLAEKGLTASEYVNNPAVKAEIDAAVKAARGAAPAAEAATGAGIAAAPAAQAANAGKLYNAARMAGKTVPKAGPLIVGAEVLENLGSYKFQEPGLDTSVSGIASALGKGEFKQAGKNLAMGLPEAVLDVIRAGAGLGDYLLPGQPWTEGVDRGVKVIFGDKVRTPSDAQAAAAQAKQTTAPKPSPAAAQAARASFAANDPRREMLKPPVPDESSKAMSQVDSLLSSLQGNAAAPAAARPAATPAAPAAPGTGIAASPILQKYMNMDPEKQRDVEAERYRKEVGAPDTGEYDRLIKAYEEEKGRINAPKAGWDAFAELMSHIAEAGPARTWGEAGTRGAAAQRARNEERAAKQLGFTEKQIELAQKKKDAERAFRKDVYEAGKKAYDDTFKNSFDALKEQGLNDRQASVNATHMATTAMQTAEAARGHTLQAQASLLQLKLGEARNDKDLQALALKSLSETAKELGGLLKDPTFAMSEDGKAARAQIMAISQEVQRRGGMNPASTGPTLSAQPTGKTLKLQ